MAKPCSPNQEKHEIRVVNGSGCTEEEAKLSIIDQLLGIAEEVRKKQNTLCEELDCGLEGKQCVISLNADDVTRLMGQIKVQPYRNKKCPKKVGWTARLMAQPPFFISECVCVDPSD